MPVPIRVVCAYCLESVETSTGGNDTPTIAVCPACGSPIECGVARAEFTDRTADIEPKTETRGEFESDPTPAAEAADSSWVRSGISRSFGRLGRFQIREWIGGGGYGDVSVAYEPHLKREIALKVLKTTKLDAKATKRFLAEAQAAAKLRHPNIVGLYDAGQSEGRFWIPTNWFAGKRWPRFAMRTP